MRKVYNKNHTIKNEKIFNTQQFRLRLEQIHGNLKALQTSIIIFYDAHKPKKIGPTY